MAPASLQDAPRGAPPRPRVPMGLLPSHTTLRKLLLQLLGVLAGAGLVVELAYALWRPRGLRPVLGFLSLSYEQNLPTWYASGLLLCCALVLAVIARDAALTGAPRRRHWWGLAVAFLYMSLDEAVGLHEHLGESLDLHGVLYFSWVVPAGALVTVLALAYLPFLAHLPARPRRQFLIAGVLYVSGALGMELPLGYWTERHGDDNLVYALIDLVEESLELLGMSLFLSALVEYLGARVRVTRVPHEH
jgi:hypothetical protein